MPSGLAKPSTTTLVLIGLLLTALVGGAVALNFAITYQATDGVTYNAGPNGPSITLGYNTDVASGNPFPDENTITLQTTDGNATFTATSDVNATLDDVTGTRTELSEMNVTAGALTINPEDKQSVSVEGDTDTLWFESMQLDDGDADFQYSGPDGGTTTLTVTSLPANTAVLAVNQSGTPLDKAETDASGDATFTLPQSTHTVELQSSSTSGPTFSNPDPTGTQSTSPSELAVTVDDDDFPTDNVTVTISLDGSQVQSTTIESETRVTHSLGSLAPGSHTWSVEATDQFGNIETDSYTFGTPDNLSVFNESAPTMKVDDRAVTVTIFSDGEQVFERSTQDGNVSLDGLPTSEDLVVVTEADGYTTRQAIIEDITVQNDVYILPENATTRTVRFELEDPTGNFPPTETQLFIKKTLNKSGTTTFHTIAADEFGVEGFTVELEEGERYRLEIKNADNDRQVLGSYTATLNETVVLQPSGLRIDYTEGQAYAWDAEYLNESGAPSIFFQYSDPANETTDLTVTIYERNNETNTLSGYPETYSGPVGNVTIDEALTSQQADKEWMVEWSADRNGEEISAQQPVGEYSVILPELDPFWAEAFAFAVILITGGLFSRENVGVGAVTTAIVGGVFYWIGWLSGATSGAAVVLGMGLAVIVWASQEGGL